MTIAAQLDAALRAVAPIIGVSIGRRDDKSSWRIDFAPEATVAEKSAAAGVITSFDVAAVENTEQAETAAVDDLAKDTRVDAIFVALRNASGAEIGNFVDTTFPAMNANQRAVLKLLLRFTALQLRRG